MTPLAKDTRLHIRCDQEMRRLLDKAAAYSHLSVSEFVLRNAVEQAQSVVLAHEAITLSQDDFAAFLDALDTPAQANPALQRALDSDAQTAGFDCGEKALDEYLQRYARQDIKHGVARVFVASPAEQSQVGAGFCTLRAASIAAEMLPRSHFAGLT